MDLVSDLMMKIADMPPITAQRLQYRTPDYREERDGLVLLVWGDLPYWTVVDHEFESLLRALDGKRRLGEIVADHAAWQAQRQEVTANLRLLRDAGIFAPPVARSPAKPPLYGTKIESVGINMTRQCNLRCRFCYNLPYLTPGNAHEITVPEVHAFLRALRPFVSQRPLLTLLGGEPLLEADKLLAVAAYARRLSYTVLVSTNGIAVTDDFARRATQLGVQVQVSLDGPTAMLHDAVRGAGAFDDAVRGVHTLRRHQTYTIVSMVCHQGNVASLADFYRFAHALGVNEARFISLKCLGGAMQGEFLPVPLDALLRHAGAILAQHPEFRALTGRDVLAIMADTCRYSWRRASCGAGLQTVLLDADGALYPCANTNHPAFAIANIREAGFAFRRAWLASPVLHDLRRQTMLATADDAHATCPVRYWCLGGCRGENYALTGSLNKRPPQCAELRRGILEMCWLLAEHPDLVRPASKRC